MNFDSEVLVVYYSPSRESMLGAVAQVSRGKGFALEPPSEFREDEHVKTLRFCIRAGHLSVLEFADITFRIKTPIFVARQLMRYRHASYMERSLRYCTPETKEWAFVIETPEEADTPYSDVIHHEEYSRTVYDELVVNGAKREWARSVLPLSTETVFLMKVNLRELLHIFKERLTLHCQQETREVVQEMYNITKELFPLTITTWEETTGGAP